VSTDELDSENCYICYHSYQFGSMDSADNETDAPICLPCSHLFGKRCILRWTREPNTCSCCRAIVYETFSCKQGPSQNFARSSSVEWRNFQRILSNTPGEVGVEPTTSWVGSWYELIGLEPADVPLDGPNNPIRPSRVLYARGKAYA
jgi:hypothetical protein